MNVPAAEVHVYRMLHSLKADARVRQDVAVMNSLA